MSVFSLLVIVHALAATVWTGGHLVLDLGVLPRALREQSAQRIRNFEELFEPLGLTALAIQVLTGLWMGWIYRPGHQDLFRLANPIGILALQSITEAHGGLGLQVFGSVVHGSAGPGSDLDLLVEFPNSPSFEQFMDLKLALEDLLSVPVDLVTRQGLRAELRQRVEEEAIPLA